MEQIGIVQAVLLGIIQGLTEFLPVSSSGNVTLFQQWFGVTGEQLTFTIILHVASALAIVFFFSHRLQRLARQLWGPVLVGTLPSVFVALFFKETVEAMFISTKLVSLALFFTGFVNLSIQCILTRRNAVRADSDQGGKLNVERADSDQGGKLNVERADTDQGGKLNEVEASTQSHSVSLSQSILIGTAQAVAITPGISRSGSTVFMGLLTGLSRKTAFDFSFLLAVPAIGGATLLQAMSEMNSSSIGFGEFISLPYFVGFVASFAASYGSLWLLKFMMERAQFWWFAVYCFGLGTVGLLFL
jgi:undecaprenyl-diphosphatase